MKNEFEEIVERVTKSPQSKPIRVELPPSRQIGFKPNKSEIKTNKHAQAEVGLLGSLRLWLTRGKIS
jgi:hypothetical protein